MPDGPCRIRTLWVQGTQLIVKRPKWRNSDREPMAELSSGQRSLVQGSSGQVDHIRVTQVAGAQAGEILSWKHGSGRLGPEAQVRGPRGID